MRHRFALFGNPVAHSLGPKLFAAYGAALGRDIDYQLRRIEPGHFAEEARNFFSGGGAGLNVTVPFKADAGAYIEALPEAAWPRGPWSSRFFGFARASGCANFLLASPAGDILPFNTDHFGFVAGLRWLLDGELRVDGRLEALRGKSMLVLGAGGAARNALVPDDAVWDLAWLRDLVVASRAPARTGEFLDGLRAAWDGADGVDIELVSYEALSGRSFDLIINATSAGHAGCAPPLPDGVLAEGGYCYDMSYGAAAKPFERRAVELGVAESHFADGLSMLVMQGLPAMPIWLESAGDEAPEALTAKLSSAAGRLLDELRAEVG